MRALMIVGLILVLLGVLTLGYQGVTYFTTRETIARVGPVEVQAERAHTVWIGPVVGGLVIAGGVALMLVSATRKAQ